MLQKYKLILIKQINISIKLIYILILVIIGFVSNFIWNTKEKGCQKNDNLLSKF